MSGRQQFFWRAAQRGFTMIELIMVMAIAVILLAVAAPSMSELIANQRVKSAAGDLHLALVRARSEGIKRNPPATSPVQLSPADGGWHKGWKIPDPQNPSADPLSQAEFSGVTVATDVASVSYNGQGRASFTMSASCSRYKFEVASAGTTLKRCVQIDTSGRARVTEGACPSC